MKVNPVYINALAIGGGGIIAACIMAVLGHECFAGNMLIAALGLAAIFAKKE